MTWPADMSLGYWLIPVLYHGDMNLKKMSIIFSALTNTTNRVYGVFGYWHRILHNIASDQGYHFIPKLTITTGSTSFITYYTNLSISEHWKGLGEGHLKQQLIGDTFWRWDTIFQESTCHKSKIFIWHWLYLPNSQWPVWEICPAYTHNYEFYIIMGSGL